MNIHLVVFPKKYLYLCIFFYMFNHQTLLGEQSKFKVIL